MQRSSKGFGIIGVACAVVFLIITAVVSASSHANTLAYQEPVQKSSIS
jgi:hypothetical protein